MKRKIIALMLCTSIVMSFTVTANAFKFPQEFWTPNDSFTAAVESGDNYGIINYGKQLIDILSPLEDAPEKRNALVDRYNKVAKAYEALGDWENSGYYFKALYDYAHSFGDEFGDYLKGAKAKYMQYIPQMAMYTDGGSEIYYGAKNEPRNGVLFGVCVNGESRDKIIDDESMILTYQEICQPLTDYNRNAFGDALMHHDAVEFALNCPHESACIDNLHNLEGNLKELSDLFSLYPEVKIFLRFAAEFDVWTDMAEPEKYKEGFRFVSDYFKKRNPNVAIVWSPNQVSGYYVKADDYYPGDEYVDWVGLSLYSVPYFIGDKNASQDNQVFFKAGNSADPVIAVGSIIKKYGSKKPIMISEAGVGHHMFATGESTEAFAEKTLRTELAYLPMIYPQIKAMAYFDVAVDSATEKYDFRLSTDRILQDIYLDYTSGDRFIHTDANANSPVCYREVVSGIELGGSFPVSCYTHDYGKEVAEVSYYIDGEWKGTSKTVPYTVNIDSKDYRGNHNLKAVAKFTDGSVREEVEVVQLNGVNDGIAVEVCGKRVAFDQPPIIENGRTMVPMRAIFEALGATVSWDDSTKTATGIKDGREVKITIGESAMYVNGEMVALDTPAMIVGGRTLVPARAIAEGLGCKVEWNGKASLVSIN